MAEQVLVQFRADKSLKQEVAEIYEALGMDLPTAFRMFMKRSVIERRLLFSANLSEVPITRERAVQSFRDLRNQAKDVPEMTIDEINGEIVAVRAGR